MLVFITILFEDRILVSNKSIIFTIVGSLLLVVVFTGVYTINAKNANGTPDELAVLASCLQEKGVKFYGAFWCPHCQEQKRDFGVAMDKLPYIECATPDGKGQTDVCKEAGITGYPTWVFANGEHVSSRVLPVNLAKVAGCPVPQSAEVSVVDTTTVTSS